MENLDTYSHHVQKHFCELLGSFTECSIDQLLDEGFLKDFPVISAISNLYKMGKSVRDLYNLKKLESFIWALNNGTATSEEKEFFLKKLQENPKQTQHQLEYILVVLDRYLNEKKPKMLALLYLAYLRGEIKWDEFLNYSEIIDHLLVGDYSHLAARDIFYVSGEEAIDAFQRLTSLGLLFEKIEVPEMDLNDKTLHVRTSDRYGKNIREFRRSTFGTKFVSLFPDDIID